MDALQVALLELGSVACVLHLWLRRDRLSRKLLWTLWVLLPIAGPLLYFAGYEPPAPNDPIDRPPEPSE